MNLARSLLYTVAFYLGSVPFVLLAALAGLVGWRRGILGIPRAWARYQYACARVCLGTRQRIDGRLPDELVLIAIKHESFYEAYETLRLFRDPAVVFKAELLRIPLWGAIALRHGVIPVEREAGAAALRAMLKAARAAVKDGRQIIIFPEGTRVPHGEEPPLRPGLAGLYKALGLPIVPIAVDSGRSWGWRSFVKRPGVVTYRVGETIPAGLPRDEVETRVHAAINALNR